MRLLGDKHQVSVGRHHLARLLGDGPVAPDPDPARTHRFGGACARPRKPALGQQRVNPALRHPAKVPGQEKVAAHGARS
jgi:hypothetical protein